MIDLHCHILPGLDDGAKSLDESLEMLRLAAAAGTTDLVATPHADLRFPFHPERVRQEIARLQELNGPVPRLYFGCDFHLFYENIESVLLDPSRFCINGHQYLLVEFADQGQPANMTRVLDELIAAGITPVITHPERTLCLQHRRDLLRDWVGRGALVQVTAQSFLGRFGRTARTVVEQLVREQLVHVVASDGHDITHRPPVLRPAYEYVLGRWGESCAAQLFIGNPRRILKGERIDLKKRRISGEVREWFRFGT